MEFDFTKMDWDVTAVPLDSDIQVFFRELADRFSEHIDRVAVDPNIFIRFVVLCYHEKSPLLNIDDVITRKKTALKILDADVPELLKPVSKHVAYAVLQFLKFENKPRHLKLMMYMESRSKFQVDLVNAKGTAIKHTIDAIERLDNLIDNISTSHMKRDDDIGDFAESYQVMESRKVYPEEYADVT